MQEPSSSRVGALALIFVAALASPAAAEPATEQAARSFERFATSWMERIGLEGALRREAAVETSPVTLRRASASFRTELQPTGKAAAPYVGLLYYVEHVYSCAGASDCRLLESSPVTEIFPFQDGEWKY